LEIELLSCENLNRSILDLQLPPLIWRTHHIVHLSTNFAYYTKGSITNNVQRFILINERGHDKEREEFQELTTYTPS